MWNQNRSSNNYQGSQSYAAGGRYNQSDRTVINTDGHCSRNGQPGASAGVGVFWGPNDARNVSRPLDGPQTNNRAELAAAHAALQQCHESGIQGPVIRTDSAYVKNGMDNWVHGWKQNGWRNADGAPVANKGDWQRLDGLQQRVGATFEKVQGHSGDYGNDQADRLARQGANARR